MNAIEKKVDKYIAQFIKGKITAHELQEKVMVLIEQADTWGYESGIETAREILDQARQELRA